MPFDGIVTKSIATELNELSGARIDKIFEPNKNNILIGMYHNRENHLLNISIDSSSYRVHLTTHPKPNPKIALNFCMVLRKHLLGLSLKRVVTSNLERIITIEFEGFDDIDDIIQKKLIIELMGKHCNIILLNSDGIIIDSIRHLNEENSNRNILPHHKYILPENTKLNILDYSDVDTFIEKVNELLSKQNTSSLSQIISNEFNGISNSFIDYCMNKLNINEVSDENIKKIHSYLFDLLYTIDSDTSKLNFNTITLKKNNGKEYSEYMLDYNKDNDTSNYNLNYVLDEFYYEKETSLEFKTYRDSVLRLILDNLKKYTKRLDNINEKLNSCKDMDIFKLYGELLTANLYMFNNNSKNSLSEITLNNYYTNTDITIKLDPKFSPSQNAKNFFKKYTKLKNTLDIVGKQKIDTINELEYIKTIIYSLESTSSISDVAEIFEEISENVIFQDTSKKQNSINSKKNSNVKKSQLTKNKNVNFNPTKYNIQGYTLLVGRNNKENDYLTLKYANSKDIWFHTKDFPGSHCILTLSDKNTIPTDEVIFECAKIAAKHSKAKDSSNVPVDYCEVKYIKKPNKSKPGMVIYTNNKTLYV